MRERDRFYWAPAAFLGVWFPAILLATIAGGVWAGVAVWIGVPFLLMVALYVAAAIEAARRRHAMSRHPALYEGSSALWIQPRANVDKRWKA